MSCTITRSQIRTMVIGVIRADLGGDITVREISRFGEDLGISADRRHGYFNSIQKEVRACGFDLIAAKPQSFQKCAVVKDVIDIVWADVEAQLLTTRTS
jgi:hypothetical protein